MILATMSQNNHKQNIIQFFFGKKKSTNRRSNGCKFQLNICALKYSNTMRHCENPQENTNSMPTMNNITNFKHALLYFR